LIPLTRIHARRDHRWKGSLGFSRWALSFVGIAALTGTACRDTPTSPSNEHFIVGGWSGTVTIERPTAAGSSAKFAWLVKDWLKPNELFVNMQSAHPWWPVAVGMAGTIDSPTRPPANITVAGPYQSPRGCVGTIRITGVADSRRIDADISGVDCPMSADSTFSGRLA